MQKELGVARGMQGGKWKGCVIWYQSLKLDPASEKMVKEVIVGFFVTKCSRWTKAKMTMVKAKKATAKEACEAKKLTKLVAVDELGSAKKLPKTPKGEREEAYGPLNPKSGEGGASTRKESAKREASTDNIQVVEQFWSSFNSS